METNRESLPAVRIIDDPYVRNLPYPESDGEREYEFKKGIDYLLSILSIKRRLEVDRIANEILTERMGAN